MQRRPTSLDQSKKKTKGLVEREGVERKAGARSSGAMVRSLDIILLVMASY